MQKQSIECMFNEILLGPSIFGDKYAFFRKVNELPIFWGV